MLTSQRVAEPSSAEKQEEEKRAIFVQIDEKWT
jgi:hypothetical protein